MNEPSAPCSRLLNPDSLHADDDGVLDEMPGLGAAHANVDGLPGRMRAGRAGGRDIIVMVGTAVGAGDDEGEVQAFAQGDEFHHEMVVHAVSRADGVGTFAL